MATKQQLIDDIILRLTKGKPSDDMELEPTQVAFWIDMVLNSLVKQTLDERIRKGLDGIDPEFICYERLIPLRKESKDVLGKFYIELCAEPINLIRDRGVIRVATEATDTEPGKGVDKMKMEEIDNLRELKHSKPSLKNIKYHRVKNKLFFYGLDDNTFHLVTFVIAYVPKTKALEELDDNDPIYISDDLLPLIADEVEKIARRQYQSDSDLENDSQQDLNVQ